MYRVKVKKGSRQDANHYIEKRFISSMIITIKSIQTFICLKVQLLYIKREYFITCLPRCFTLAVYVVFGISFVEIFLLWSHTQ